MEDKVVIRLAGLTNTSGDPLSNGINPGHAVVLVTLALACLLLALIAFERRDVGT